MTSREFAEWKAFYRVEGWGQNHRDLLSAWQTMKLYLIQCKPDTSLRLAEFLLPDDRPSAPAPAPVVMSTEAMKASFASFKAALAGYQKSCQRQP